MKRKSCFPLFLFFAFSAYQIFPSNLMAFVGHISVDTVWYEDVVITGDVIVDAGVQLTISPGVTVYFVWLDQDADAHSDIDFVVNGNLQCNGTTEQKVTFTSYEGTPTPGDWAGMLASSPTNSVVLQNTEVHYAHTGITIIDCNATFTNVTVADSETDGRSSVHLIWSTWRG